MYTCCLLSSMLFQNLYRIVYAFLGNVLGISDEFPPPKELFTASAWVVLYTSCSSGKSKNEQRFQELYLVNYSKFEEQSDQFNKSIIIIDLKRVNFYTFGHSEVAYCRNKFENNK